ncbi:unnamed protein product [Protopolystoma xenopodis]|uniref:Uncharacterized protein n=1 Tax=Protopolystoma xenopodis TaxID=117903 RepID=A0A448XJ63_9PLAT|nr:unnamed protein product [Protopolystoma xenopodis]
MLSHACICPQRNDPTMHPESPQRLSGVFERLLACPLLRLPIQLTGRTHLETDLAYGIGDIGSTNCMTIGATADTTKRGTTVGVCRTGSSEAYIDGQSLAQKPLQETAESAEGIISSGRVSQFDMATGVKSAVETTSSRDSSINTTVSTSQPAEAMPVSLPFSSNSGYISTSPFGVHLPSQLSSASNIASSSLLGFGIIPADQHASAHSAVFGPIEASAFWRVFSSLPLLYFCRFIRGRMASKVSIQAHSLSIRLHALCGINILPIHYT